MRKIGIDQTTAWIFSFFLTAFTFGGLYGVTKLGAKAGQGTQGEHHGADPHESGHGESADGHDSKGSHEAAPAHGAPTASHHEAEPPTDAHGKPQHTAPTANDPHHKAPADAHASPVDAKKHEAPADHHK